MGGFSSVSQMVKRAFGAALLLTICVLIFAVAMQYFDSTGESSEGASEELLLQSLQEAASVCYSIEGVYPPTLTYLCENYDVFIDETRFVVYYSVFADNLMPEITVLPIGG